MPIAFKAAAEPPLELLERVSVLQPENPFYTAAYVNAMRVQGFTPFVLSLEHDGRLLSACTAFSKQGWLNHRLEITSLPVLYDRGVFWTGLLDFCRKQKLSVLEVNSFGSSEAVIEELPCETARKERYEFQLDLDGTDLWGGLNRHHKRQIKKANEAGLRLEQSSDLNACEDHSRMATLSMDRRIDHGEQIDYQVKVQDSLAFTQNGAGEIYQAMLGDEVLSSILVLRSEKGAYAQTSGTSPAGMECGASQFLWYEIACCLQKQSLTLLNMGGTDIASRGLQDFKESFGARRIELESAEFYLGGKLRKAIGAVVNR